MAPETWLEGELSLRFAHARAPLAFSIGARARRIAVFGPSGSGKSTLLKILAGVERRARGTLRVDGAVWQDTNTGAFLPASQRRVGWVPQNALLFPHLTVEENLLFSPGARDADWRGIAQQLQIDHLLERQPRNLSGGESQRVALGRALLSRPRLLLLDEPLSALNDSLRIAVASFLAEHCIRNDLPMILATHRRSEAQALCEETLDWDPALQKQAHELQA
jgi:molybdate transport system ATP-binding protein